MANTKGLKSWKKGQSGNPKGRPPDALGSALKRLTKDELEEIANIIIRGNRADLERIAKDPATSNIQALVASAVIKIMKTGDIYMLDTLLNRLIGKVKDTVHHTGDGSIAPPTVIVKLPDNGRTAK